MRHLLEGIVYVALGAAVLLGQALESRAGLIVNGGFEDPVLTDAETINYPTLGIDVVSEWGGWPAGQVGAVNPTGAQFAGAEGDGPLPAPAAGSQCAYILPGSILWQQLPVTIQDNTIYTISADLGSPLDEGQSGAVYLYFTDIYDVVGGLNVATVGGPGSFASNSFAWDSTGSPFVGHAMRAAVYFESGAGRLMVDNFQVVPEPHVVVLLAFGLLALAACAWRKRK